MPKAAILGCGPAGLFAAHACQTMGVDFRIFSKVRPSSLYGSQFLGVQIPGLTAKQQTLDVMLEGTEADYAAKVYGEFYTGPVSPAKYVGHHSAYDIRWVYQKLWNSYYSKIEGMEFAPRTFAPIVRAMLDMEFDFVFSTLPLRDFCQNKEHRFFAVSIWAVGDAPDLDVRAPVRRPEGTITYCANDASSWYRASNIFGYCTVEWPAANGQQKPPFAGVVRVEKPLGNNCTCNPEVVRIGRYGEWRKGVLAYDAYPKTLEHLTTHGVQSVLF